MGSLYVGILIILNEVTGPFSNPTSVHSRNKLTGYFNHSVVVLVANKLKKLCKERSL